MNQRIVPNGGVLLSAFVGYLVIILDVLIIASFPRWWDNNIGWMFWITVGGIFATPLFFLIKDVKRNIGERE